MWLQFFIDYKNFNSRESQFFYQSVFLSFLIKTEDQDLCSKHTLFAHAYWTDDFVRFEDWLDTPKLFCSKKIIMILDVCTAYHLHIVYVGIRLI